MAILLNLVKCLFMYSCRLMLMLPCVIFQFRTTICLEGNQLYKFHTITRRYIEYINSAINNARAVIYRDDVVLCRLLHDAHVVDTSVVKL